MREVEEPDLQPDPDYHYIKASSMRSRMRRYDFRRGQPLTKAPDSNCRGWEDGHSERKDSKRESSILDRQKKLTRIASADIIAGLMGEVVIGHPSTNGHSKPTDTPTEKRQGTNGSSPSYIASETPFRGGLDGANMNGRRNGSPRR